MPRQIALQIPEAEAIALNALRFLADDANRLNDFLAASGASAEILRERAGHPEFLAGVLDYLLADESLLLAFAAHEGLAPGIPAAARALLPGAAPC